MEEYEDGMTVADLIRELRKLDPKKPVGAMGRAEDIWPARSIDEDWCGFVVVSV